MYLIYMVAFFITIILIISLLGLKFVVGHWQKKQRFIFNEMDDEASDVAPESEGILKKTVLTNTAPADEIHAPPFSPSVEVLFDIDDEEKPQKEDDTIDKHDGVEKSAVIRERIELTTEDFKKSMKRDSFQLTSPNVGKGTKKTGESFVGVRDSTKKSSAQIRSSFPSAHRETARVPVKRNTDDGKKTEGITQAVPEYKDYVFYLITDEELIDGKSIKIAVDRTRMRYDVKKKCFVYNVDNNEWFRLCNAVNPLLFSMRELNNLKTRGIILAMRLPINPSKLSEQAFKAMCEVAKQISRSLNVSICDANRTPLGDGDLESMQIKIAEEYGLNK